VIDKIKAQLREFEELRQKMIDDPKIDGSATESAADKIDESMPD
jgi:hypothetical protein